MPTGKIELYTRSFEFANFRLPLSTFLVDVLRYYRIYISQLSVIAAAKVSYFEILCRVHDCEPTVGLFRCFYVNSKNKGWMYFSKRPGHDVVCYTKPLDSLKGWNDHFFWVNAFACPASLVVYPALFHKYPELFLCLVGISLYYTLDENTYPEFLHESRTISLFEMDLLTFIRTADPTKVRIGERQRGEDEPKLLDTNVGRVVPLLPVAPARGESELEDSVDRLFDEEGNDGQAEQGDSASGGQGVGIQPVSGAVETNIKDVVPKRQEKQKSVIVDYDEPSHPAKKLRKDSKILVGTSVAGKSMPAIQQLIAGAVQNAAVRGEPVPSLPFVTFVISSDFSHHSGTHIAESEVDSLIRSSAPAMTTATTITVTAGAATVVKEAVAKPSLFATGSSSVGGTESILVGFLTLLVMTFGHVLTTIEIAVRWWMSLHPPKFFASVHGMKHDQLFAEFNVGAAHQMTLSTKVRMRAEYNIKEKRRLKYVVNDQAEVLKVKEEKVKDLKAQLLLKEAEAGKVIHLRVEASKIETAKKSLQDEIRSLKERNAALEKEKGELGVRVVDLSTSVKVREQEVATLDAVVTTVKLQNNRLVDQVHKLETSCVRLQEKVAVYENYMSQLEKL
ncbi:hypothetical protein Tco_1270768, partial [Tanacetum coccineum]